jgi:WD40 repeat protein
MGSTRFSVWDQNRSRIGWLTLGIILGIIVLPWLPFLPAPGEATPARTVRGVGDFQTLFLAFAPDGETIATIQTDGRVALRQTAGGERFSSVLGYPGQAKALAFLPDGRTLAVGGSAADIYRYDLNDGGAGRPLGMPIRDIKALTVSSDGRTLAASSYLDQEILLWDLATGRERGRLETQEYPGPNLAFAPDGRFLASGGMRDPAIIVWDLSTGQPRLRLSVPPGGITALAYSPDGGWPRPAVPIVRSGSGT